jgi:hypothetical protein
MIVLRGPLDAAVRSIFVLALFVVALKQLRHRQSSKKRLQVLHSSKPNPFNMGKSMEIKHTLIGTLESFASSSFEPHPPMDHGLKLESPRSDIMFELDMFPCFNPKISQLQEEGFQRV